MHLLNNLAAASQPSRIPTDLNPLIPQKIGIFIWRAKQNKLPVRSELDKKGIDLHSVRCPVCDDDIETLLHSLLKCSNSMDIWNRIQKWWSLDHLYLSCIYDLAKGSNPQLISNLGSSLWQAVGTTTYYIWIHRNDRVFSDKNRSSSKIVSEIQSKCYEWINCRWKKGTLDWLKWISNPRWFDANQAKVGIG
ncbi:uncharacterized protein [Rutidosis leptorrhynchoides]|uniref:uncharacterized protein n=1 Tax=Rutidosis leptorrhynchoides TaxID=125765 RepID=UPI003A9926F1